MHNTKKVNQLDHALSTLCHHRQLPQSVPQITCTLHGIILATNLLTTADAGFSGQFEANQ